MKRICALALIALLLLCGCGTAVKKPKAAEIPACSWEPEPGFRSNFDWKSILEDYGSASVFRPSDRTAAHLWRRVGRMEEFGAFTELAEHASENGSVGSLKSELGFFEMTEAHDFMVTYRGWFCENGIKLCKLDGVGNPAEWAALQVEASVLQRIVQELSELPYVPDVLARVYGNTIIDRYEFTDSVGTVLLAKEKEYLEVSTLAWMFESFSVVRDSCREIDFSEIGPFDYHISAQMHTIMTRQEHDYDFYISPNRLVLAQTVSGQAVGVWSYEVDCGLTDWLTAKFHPVESIGDVPTPNTAKPVIYLYPETKTEVKVTLAFGGTLGYTYPTYRNGWDVTAYPDGRLINRADGTEHYYLFWDGMSHTDWDFSQGFCVAGADTEKFLVSVLPQMGLTPREYNDFIVYWLPEMRQNAYNLITFATAQYEELAALTVTPKPDSVLRVHMVYRPLSEPVTVTPQQITPFERTGFTVVEWGGTRVK